ncbi:MAG: hypothetical protein M3Z92_02835 [Bacteroidota bacterium]|nr:hypothetical protein [Bacteroidota bacterium]MDQ6890562.1 hypothetical protein [Bacteroidota bacterium]
MKNIKNLVLFAAFSLLAACSSTKVTSSWKAPEATAANLSMKKIMVAALLPDRNRDLQRTMEKQLVSELNSKGIQAISAYEVYGPKYFPKGEQKAVDKLRESGVDGFLTIVLLDKSKEKNYNPGYSQIEPIGYYRNWFGYYRTVYGRVYTPGYYTTQNKYYWESNLYSLPDEKLIYSAQSQSFDPSSVAQLANDYSNKILNDMAKQGLLAKK